MKQKKIFYGWWIVLGCVLVACTMVPLVMSLANKSLLLITEEFGVSRSAFTLVLGSVTPPLITATIFGQQKYGEVYGIVNSASQVGLSLGSLFVASMFDITGTYQFSWMLLTTFTVLIAVCWISAYLQAKKYSYANIAIAEPEEDISIADTI